MTSAALDERRQRARGSLARLTTVYGANRYGVLFYTLIFTLGASPLLTALHFNADLLQIFLAFSLLVALLDIPDQSWRAVLMLLAAIAVGLRVAPMSTVGVEVRTGALVVGSGIALLGAASAVRFAMRARGVTAEQIYAALSAYLLAGLGFGVIHWAIGITWPGSYGEAGVGDTPAGLSLSTAIYYSFVTLATLGYGDVVPKTEVARGVAVLEAVGGQLYIAVTVARLVGAQLQSVQPSESGGDIQRDFGGPTVRP
jgi:ion channel